MENNEIIEMWKSIPFGFFVEALVLNYSFIIYKSNYINLINHLKV